MENKYVDKTKLLEDIKQLGGYEGYIQFSDTKIRGCDIFDVNDAVATKIQPTGGFVYEAHFCNDKNSISLRQINDAWLVDETDISAVPDEDKQSYHAIGGRKVKMAQVWMDEPDELCEGMMVKKLKKVVFAGFENGGIK